MSGIHKRDQSDHVREMLSKDGRTGGSRTERVYPPGIEDLHKRSIDEVAQTLAHVLRSRPLVTELRYVAGEYVELTFTPPR